MEGGSPDGVAVLANQIDEALAHLSRGGFGEGEGENGGGIGVGFGEDVGDADGENLSFPGPRAGHNYDRSVDGIDGFFLIFIE